MKALLFCQLLCAIIVALIISVLPCRTNAQPITLVPPLEGVQGTDWFIVNYVDHDSSSGILDHNCGTHTYDGHQGTDFVIRDFKSMDSGVGVRAVDYGIVTAVFDTAYDRNKLHVPGKGFGNWISVFHPQSQIISYYGHIRKGSTLVKVGDTVLQGQRMALVGSAGDASDPHVHLELWYRDSVLLDPFTGNCSSLNPSIELADSWRPSGKPRYDTTQFFIEHGLIPWVATLDTIRERLQEPAAFGAPDTAITYWAHMYGVRKGSVQTIEWRIPDGSPWFTYTFPAATQDYWYYYFWSYISMPSFSGTWSVHYSIDSVEVANKSFVVTGISSINQPVAGNSPVRVYSDGNGNLTVSGLPNRNTKHITLELFDISGRKVETLFDDVAPTPTLHVNSRSGVHGVYLLRIATSSGTYSVAVTL